MPGWSLCRWIDESGLTDSGKRGRPDQEINMTPYEIFAIRYAKLDAIAVRLDVAPNE